MPNFYSHELLSIAIRWFYILTFGNIHISHTYWFCGRSSRFGKPSHCIHSIHLKEFYSFMHTEWLLKLTCMLEWYTHDHNNENSKTTQHNTNILPLTLIDEHFSMLSYSEDPKTTDFFVCLPHKYICVCSIYTFFVS